MDFVILEVTNEGIAFLISQHAVSFFLVVYPCTYVCRAVSIRHFSIVAFVFNIIADISLASAPSKCAMAVSLLVQPQAFIRMPIRVRVLFVLGYRSNLLTDWLSHLN